MRKITRKMGIIVISLAVLATIGIAPVLAQPNTPQVAIDDMEDILAIVNRIVGWAFVFVFALAAVLILWAAFGYLTSGGDEKKIGAAKLRLIYATLGIGIALIARSVVPIIEALMG